MQNEAETRIRNDLKAEIRSLEKQYFLIKNYLSGTECDNAEIIGRLQVFKDCLNKISAHIITLYTMKGQKTKITWDPLFVNLENALATLSASAKRKPRETIQLAFNMSEPKVEEIMTYLSNLRETL